MSMTDLCPACGAPLEFDEVDIGVGVQRGNFGCPDCHWVPSKEVQMTEPDLKFDVIFKRGAETVAHIHGMPRSYDAVQVGDVAERIIETEQHLERLTGLRVHIQTAEDSDD